MATINPELVFEDERATPRFPIPVIKHAVVVPVHENFPSFIQPEWDDDGHNPQVFIGNYFLILDDDGRGRYGSAYDQWINMHRQIPPTPGQTATSWVKTTVPMGYHTGEDLDIVTMIPDPNIVGGIQEARKTIGGGTLVLRQPGGEIQHVRRADEEKTYFSSHTAEMLGLTSMTLVEFDIWAIENATPAHLLNEKFFSEQRL